MLYWMQDGIVFPGGDMNEDNPGQHGWPYEEIRLSVLGEETYGWFVKHDGPTRGTVLFSHGNAGTISDRLGFVENFRALNLDVLVYDYGGFGYSTGAPSEDRCYADIRAMWDFLVDDRGVAPESVLLWGRSLGGGPTSELATLVDEGAVILESTFTSVPAMGARQYPIYPVFVLEFIVRTQFSSVTKVGAIGCPLLVVHSPNDTVVPYALGEELFVAASESKTFLSIEGDHNRGYMTEGRTTGILNFLQIHLPLDTSSNAEVEP